MRGGTQGESKEQAGVRSNVLKMKRESWPGLQPPGVSIAIGVRYRHP
jgi:hypothetical protein